MAKTFTYGFGAKAKGQISFENSRPESKGEQDILEDSQEIENQKSSGLAEDEGEDRSHRSF